MKYWYMLHRDESLKHYAKWKKARQNVDTMYDFIYMKHPEKANPLRQKVGYWFSVAEGKLQQMKHDY